MKRTTIFIDEHLESDLHSLARRTKRPVASLVREALARYVAGEKRRARPLNLGFVAVGRSGRRDTAARHEDLLWRDLGPHGTGQKPRARRRRA